ncbi:MAG TPA: purine-nucleoside phosphorylase, partial [Bacteroidota bacterium]|nr:purine-nucleoside phosphorylase [Bacteroidota bacterium]
MLRTQINDALKVIRSRTNSTPAIGIILGTGLGGLAKEIEQETEIEYGSIPHFPISTVESHHGKLIFGSLAGKQVVAMQ